MRDVRILAIKLRKKRKSYNEISKILGIPKSTLHYWFRNLRWSEEIKKELTRKAIRKATKRMRILIKINKQRWEKWRKKSQKAAKKEFSKLKSNPIFIAGIMLYCGEGDNKPRSSVRIANTNPRIIKLFYKFLRKICKIPKEKVYVNLLLYPDLQEEKCKNFWYKQTGIPLKQFGKSTIISGRHPTKKLENGICLLKVKASGELKEKILVWEDLLLKYLLKKNTVRE
jgi:DNA-binding Lrp family transcriptional regulator